MAQEPEVRNISPVELAQRLDGVANDAHVLTGDEDALKALDVAIDRVKDALRRHDEGPLDWDKAYHHFTGVLFHYVALLGQPGVNTQFALSLTLAPIAHRYLEGDRSQELFEEMMGVE